MSSNSSSDSDNDFDFGDHEFVCTTKRVLGKEKLVVKLVHGPYVFDYKKQKVQKCGVIFTFKCHLCHLYAKALKLSDGDPPMLELIACPKPTAHACVPDSMQYLKKKFVTQVYQSVRVDLLLSVAQCYKNVRSKFTADLSEDEKVLFLSVIPALKGMSAHLYRHRKEGTPADPKTLAELTVMHSWLMENQ